MDAGWPTRRVLVFAHKTHAYCKSLPSAISTYGGLKCCFYDDCGLRLYGQVEFSHDLELTNGHIYAITDFDLFVIVKYVQNPTTTGTCTCSPVTVV